MARALIAFNRSAPAVVVVVGLMAGGWKMATMLPQTSGIPPLDVPSVVLPAMASRPVTWPTRGLVTADGSRWQLVVEKAAAKPVAEAAAKVTGVINLPQGPKGVMVDKKFVSVGKPLNGGILKDVEDSHYVIEVNGALQTRPLDAGRKARVNGLLGKQ